MQTTETTPAVRAREDLRIALQVEHQIRRRIRILEEDRQSLGLEIAHEEVKLAAVKQDQTELRSEIRLEETR